MCFAVISENYPTILKVTYSNSNEKKYFFTTHQGAKKYREDFLSSNNRIP